MRVGRGTEIVVASHNPGKVREIRELLEPLGVFAIGAADAGLSEPEETGVTFEANAILKARAAADASSRIALADDSGLCVDALGGAPGVYSARWAGPNNDFRFAMARVAREIETKKVVDPKAKFVCVLALAEPRGEVRTFVGEVDGRLTFPPRGDKGFGYDPIFVADGMQETFGEIAPPTKHGMSHRARAFKKLIESQIFTP